MISRIIKASVCVIHGACSPGEARDKFGAPFPSCSGVTDQEEGPLFGVRAPVDCCHCLTDILYLY